MSWEAAQEQAVPAEEVKQELSSSSTPSFGCTEQAEDSSRAAGGMPVEKAGDQVLEITEPLPATASRENNGASHPSIKRQARGSGPSKNVAAPATKPLNRNNRVRRRTSSALSRVGFRTSSVGSESENDFESLWRSLSARSTRRRGGLTRTHQLSVGSSSSSSPYLSYYDILLTNEDVKALKSDWLTDNNIAFWEEWLEREILPQYPQARICLLRPTMTFMMMRAVDLTAIIDALPNFKNVTHIFLPINDNHDTTQGEGGTHWSLLLVSVIDGIAFHYDSLHGSNWAEAQSCTRKLQQILNYQQKVNISIRFMQLNDCPQQENMNDCGVFVCIIMRHLLIKRLLNANANEKVSMSMKDKRIDSYGGRKEMLRIIESLRKEGERRRSASPFATSRTPPRIE